VSFPSVVCSSNAINGDRSNFHSFLFLKKRKKENNNDSCYYGKKEEEEEESYNVSFFRGSDFKFLNGPLSLSDSSFEAVINLD
jgi:hypothetical protein